MATDANYPELAEQVERVFSERGWSNEKADMVTRIGRSTIHRMRHGTRPGLEKLRAWALRLGEPVEDWYRWAGYGALVEPIPVPALPRLIPRGMDGEPAPIDAPDAQPLSCLIPRAAPDPDEGSQEADPGEETQEVPEEIAQALSRVAAFTNQISREGARALARDLGEVLDRHEGDERMRQELERLRKIVQEKGGDGE